MKDEIKKILADIPQDQVGGMREMLKSISDASGQHALSLYVPALLPLAKTSHDSPNITDYITDVVVAIIKKTPPQQLSPDFVSSLNPLFSQIMQVRKTQPSKESLEALEYILKKNSQPVEKILEQFRTLLPRKPEPDAFKGHSVSFETEFFAQLEDNDAEKREVRSGPYVDGELRLAFEALDNAHMLTCARVDGKPQMSTVHLNFGLTRKQRDNFKQNRSDYESILDQICYLANSTRRNLKITSYRNIPSAQLVGREEGQKEFFEDCSGKKKQIARLECPLFSFASDADVEIIKQFIPAFWRALDDPDRAHDMNLHLQEFFMAANIGRETIPYPKREPNVTQWEQDFGMIDADGEVRGRQTSFRPFVGEYLEAFAQGKESEAYGRLYPRIKEQQAIFLSAEKDANPALGRTYTGRKSGKPGIGR